MSKIICDVCGTSYPETANQCPICGCVRPVDAVTVMGNTGEAQNGEASTYTHVKGGRFSKSNVKKRNQGKAVSAAPQEAQAAPEKSGKGDKAIIVVVIAILLAIVAIVSYIAIRYFFPKGISLPEETTVATGESIETTELLIPCESLEVSDTVIELDKAGAAFLLNVKTVPAKTTDVITYATSDDTVAVVTDDGKVVAVAGGEAVITITCGEITAQCQVVCTIEPPTEETTVPVYPTDDFKFNRSDFTLNNYGDTWTLYKGEIPVDVITWTTDDEKVVTIDKGVVTAVGKGYTTVYGEYGGIKVSCIVRCADTVKAPAETQAPAEKNYTISSTDVTIKKGDSFTLTLKDKNGKEVEVSWISANSGICTVSGNKVTAVEKGQTTVSATVDGESYTCIVRVTNS